MRSKIDHYFEITKRGSTFKKEITGGITAYLAMSYIIFVNPIILSSTGMPEAAIFAATIIASAIAMFIMGIYAKYPLGLAPCMSMNAFFAYSVCLGMGIPWQTALSSVLVASVLFILLSLSNMRAKIILSIPSVLKQAGTVGLGLFIAFVGMKNSGLIVKNDSILITFGSFSNPNVIVAIIGIVVAAILLVRKNQYAVFISMVVAVVAGLALRYLNDVSILSYTSEQLAGLPLIPSGSPITLPIEPLQSMFNETLFVAVTNIGSILNIQVIAVVLTFLFLDFFGTATTLSAATSQIPEFSKANLENAQKVYVADAVGTFIGATLGTSSLSTYIESVSGVLVGARTGLMVVVTGILFLLSLFMYPLLSLVTAAVTTPALVIIGIFMMKNIKGIEWGNNFEEVIPAFITIVMMPLTGSIALGLTLGFVSYVLLMLCAKKASEVPKAMYGIALVSLLYLATL